MKKVVSCVNKFWVRVKSLQGLRGLKEKLSLCNYCKHYKPGQKDSCEIEKELARFEKLTDMSMPVFECQHCILRDDVDKSEFECYEHHDLVMVKKEAKGKHRDLCLCHHCTSFHPGKDDNCPKAQELFKLCVEKGLVTPVFECPFLIPG